jgi:peptidoglycan/xylan/chitin deacetylase (PgdA/CDA1 family)
MRGRRRILIVSSVAAAAVALLACSKGDTADKSCTGEASAALSFASGYNNGFCASNPSAHCTQGTAIPAKTLVFTFDDGPGSQTLQLSAYLKTKGIKATFFVNGHCFNASPPPQCQQAGLTPADIFTQVLADGHLVQNHTQTHADLSTDFPAGAAGDSAIVKELSDTDAIIAPFVTNNRFLFRAPFGSWSARDYTVLNASAMSKYTGPVKWDIGGTMVGQNPAAASSYAADWDCWQNTNGFGVKTTKECGDRYFHEIAAIGRGITLMHDADYGDVTNHSLTSGKGNTIDMVKYLLEGNAGLGVSGLLAQGYSFMRLDDVPDLASLLPPLPAAPDAGPDADDAGSDASASIVGNDSGASSPKPPAAPDTKNTPVTTQSDPCAH